MPKPDGTMYPWERAELSNAQAHYNKAVDETRRHSHDPHSAKIYESLEKRAFANLMAVTAKYAGCK